MHTDSENNILFEGVDPVFPTSKNETDLQQSAEFVEDNIPEGFQPASAGVRSDPTVYPLETNVGPDIDSGNVSSESDIAIQGVVSVVENCDLLETNASSGEKVPVTVAETNKNISDSNMGEVERFDEPNFEEKRLEKGKGIITEDDIERILKSLVRVENKSSSVSLN